MTTTEKKLRAALEECVTALRLAVRRPIVDPHYEQAVEELGKRIGYGRLMSSARASWRKKLEQEGLAGGEFCSGPCVATAENALKTAMAALVEMPEKRKMRRS